METHDEQATGPRSITPEMTVLDVISRFRNTEAVFRKYDAAAGVCLCCEALFEPLSHVADKYGLDLVKLMADLKAPTTS